MDEDKSILEALKAARDDASPWDAIAEGINLADAMPIYLGHKMPGDEDYFLPGVMRSSIVSRDVYEGIEWLVPEIIEPLIASDDIVQFEAEKGFPEPVAEQMTKYARYCFFSEAQGELLLEDAVKDAAVHRLGIIRVDYKEPEDGDIQKIETDDPLEALQLSESAEEVSIDTQTEVVTLGIREKKPGKIAYRGVRRQDFRITNKARSTRQKDSTGPVYVAEEILLTRQELKAMYPDMIEEIDDISDDTVDSGVSVSMESKRLSANNYNDFQQLLYLDEYIKLFENDRIVMRNVCRVGDTIFSNEVVKDNPFALFRIIRKPNEADGLSLVDELADIQAAKTTLLRNAIDSSVDSASPLTFVDMNRTRPDALQNVIMGKTRYVPVDGNPREVMDVQPLADTSPNSFAAFEQMSGVRDRRIGMVAGQASLDQQYLGKSATGAEILDTRGMQRKKLFIRNIAIGLGELFQKTARLIAENAEEFNGILGEDDEPINPMQWKHDARVSVHIGQSMLRAEQKLGQLAQIEQAAMVTIEALGPDNPSCPITSYIEIQRAKVSAIGYRDAGKFFKPLPEGWQPPEQPDPAQAEMQAKMQVEQFKAQSAAQLKEQEMQIKAKEVEVNAAIKREQMIMDAELKHEQMNAEIALKEREMMLNNEVKKMAVREGAKAQNTGSSVRMGGKAG